MKQDCKENDLMSFSLWSKSKLGYLRLGSKEEHKIGHSICWIIHSRGDNDDDDTVFSLSDLSSMIDSEDDMGNKEQSSNKLDDDTA